MLAEYCHNFGNVASTWRISPTAIQPLIMFNVVYPPAFYTNSQAA